MAYYDEQLQELQQQIGRKNRLDSILKELDRQRKELEEKTRELESVMYSEQADVEQLERRSLASFFYNVVGKMDEKLDKERAEAYAAKVKYDAAANELAAVQRDIEGFERERRSLQNCEERYEQILREKEHSIKVAGGEAANEIFKIEERISYLEGQKKELREAVRAGEAALETTEKILSSLNSAEGWGVWDLAGGGLVADMVKHSHLDDAQHAVECLQGQLRSFKTELADVKIDSQMQVNVDGFLRFADYFFDGLFADWAVMDKISKAQGQVNDTKRQIQTILSQLNSMERGVEAEQQELKQKRDSLVVHTSI